VAILSGVPDTVIAREHGFSRPAVQRHRLNHIVTPAQHVAMVAGKDRHAVQERAALASATSADPNVWLALDSITGDLKRVQDRLDRAADEAASVKQHGATAALSAQLLRGVEMRAKLGGVGQNKEAPGSGFNLSITIGDRGVVIDGRVNDEGVKLLAGEVDGTDAGVE
jgi:hypothetical protein